MTQEEEWRPVVSWEGLYEVSSLGRVKRLHRVRSNPSGGTSTLPERVMVITPGTKGYSKVALTQNGVQKHYSVHRLVCEAFHGPAPEGKPWALHRNGNPGDNQPENLYWGSPEDNARDTIRHGTNAKLNKVACVNGHPYTEENTYWRPDGKGRDCRECRRAVAKMVFQEARGLPPGDHRHGTVYGYTGFRCKCVECTQAWRDYGRETRVKSRPMGT